MIRVAIRGKRGQPYGGGVRQRMGRKALIQGLRSKGRGGGKPEVTTSYALPPLIIILLEVGFPRRGGSPRNGENKV